MLVRVAKADIGMFRFLLEAYENLAFFTVLEREPPLLKLVFTAESKQETLQALTEIGRAINVELEDWPLTRRCQETCIPTVISDQGV